MSNCVNKVSVAIYFNKGGVDQITKTTRFTSSGLENLNIMYYDQRLDAFRRISEATSSGVTDIISVASSFA